MNALTGSMVENESASSEGPPAHLHTLRRTGRKAVRFTGWQIVEARGVPERAVGAGTMWYDLALYRSVADAIIVELISRRAQLDEQDTHRVEVFTALQDASSWLENYDCANDVPISRSLAANNGPVTDCVLKAVQLRQLLTQIREDYRDLLSDLFEALDITEPESALRCGTC